MDQEKAIIEYLENSFTGARAMGDYDMMVRLRRAINAFNLDTETDCDLDYVLVENGNIMYL